jgi:peptide/nickel transport system substrate-binding protein
VLFLAALPACTSENSSPPPASVLTIGFPEGAVSGAGVGLGQLTTTFTLEGLTQVGVDGRVLPRLAESWTWEDDFLALRLDLRPDVWFHDGTPLTSSVVADSLDRAIARPRNLALYSSLNDIRQVRPVDDGQLVIDLSQRSAFLLEELDLPLETGPSNAGTGAFRLVSRDASGVVLERFDRYYLGTPDIERIVIRPFDTLRTAWTNLLRGEVDMVTDVPAEAIEFIGNDDVQVISFERRYQFLIAFNSERAPFTSPAVRRALNAAIDREALIANALAGKGQPATGPLWPKHWAYDASVQLSGFDPRFAESLLDGEGFRNGASAGSADSAPARLRFTCLIPEDFSLLEQIGLEVQKQLYDVGVDMQFEVVPIQEYDSRIRERRFDAALIDMISGPTFARPYIFWRSARESRGFNFFGYENPEAERLFQILRTSVNEAATRSGTQRLQRAFQDDPPALFLAWNERARAVTRRFRVFEEPGQDPLHTIWQWTENTDR